MRLGNGPTHRGARRALVTGAAIATAAVAIAGCGGSSGGKSSTGSNAPNSTSVSAGAGSNGASSIGTVHKGGNLTIYYSLTTYPLDPAKSWALATTFMGYLDRRLTAWKVSTTGAPEVVPDLATNTGVASDGGRVWTYHLKSGIYFSNGQPITSYDVKYGVERTYTPSLAVGLNYQKPLIADTNGYTGPFTGKSLSSIQTPNANTIIFHLNKPYGDWPWVVSTTSMAPVPVGKAPAATFGNDPITSGPYKVQSYTAGRQVVLVRNPYWKQSTDPVRTAGPNKITMILNENATTEAQTLIADGANAQDAFGADTVPAAQLTQAEANPSVKTRLVTSSASPIWYLSLNMKSPKLQNKLVREALEYAIDRRALVIAAGGPDAAIPATTLITPGIAGRVSYDMYPAGSSGNIAKAKALLKQSGVKNLSLTLVSMNDPTSTAYGQAIQQAYKQIGVNVTLKPESETAWTAVTTGNGSGGYDLNVSSWQPDFPSALDLISPLYLGSMIGNGNYNISRLDDPTINALINKATGTVDPTAADALWAKTDKAIMATASVVPLTYQKQSFLRGSNVANFFIPTFPAYPDYTSVSLNP